MKSRAAGLYKAVSPLRSVRLIVQPPKVGEVFVEIVMLVSAIPTSVKTPASRPVTSDFRARGCWHHPGGGQESHRAAG